ncbi:MAG: ATP-binding protein [Ignavibacteria bacterium]|jgi:serine/threonine-protein kinase RsbW|nr:ATP-binding protein [Ignavibacteria bacterium]
MMLDIKINAKLEELANMRQQIMSFIKNVSLDNEVANLIVLAVDEICTNLIKYAYKYNQNSIIAVLVETCPHQIIIKIKDSAVPFDIRQHLDKNICEHIRKMVPGGLGMPLVGKIMDEIYYEAKNDEREFNVLTLIKDI